MKPFITHTGLVAPLDRVNVDTDQMVPKQFLKALTRQGFGRILFYDWRYLPGEKPNPDFVLNFPRYKGASVLLARANFGCGSSREHAPWAHRRLRLPRHPRPQLRRHLPQQLFQKRHSPRRTHRATDRRTLPARRQGRRLLTHYRPPQSNRQRQSRPRPTNSKSPRPAKKSSSRASTTSAPPSNTSPTSPPTKNPTPPPPPCTSPST